MLSGRTENTPKHQNDGFCKKLLRENVFEALLATFCCYDYGANTSEVVQKVDKDQKDYCKCSTCVKCAEQLKYINQEQCKTVGYVAKKAAESAQERSDNWPMVSFVHNGSDITTWMGYNFKIKNTKSKVTFL